MPVTKTAKRALRGSLKKQKVNTLLKVRLDTAIRNAKKNKGAKNIITVVSLADIAAKNKVIHKNKAARIKQRFAKKIK